MFYKSEFRKEIFTKRQQLGKTAIVQHAAQLAAQVFMLPAFKAAEKIGYYAACQGEADPIVIAQCAHLLGKSLCLPIMQMTPVKTVTFYEYQWGAKLVKNQFGIEEPECNQRNLVSAEQIDCYLMPLVGFDAQGNRLGRGAGYYDRYLAFTKDLPKEKRPILIGLAYEFQKIGQIIPDDWDVPMDYVVTEKTIYERL